ncbi:hypothetical protein [Maricaulis maris]|jgi:hypothetical protein|uniref:hypothetical protein n=1 Tax=Maricaulis maris TaxID=74318 RepID=UPI0026EB2986|nr:hypothetical protein [Maricaulis maris]
MPQSRPRITLDIDQDPDGKPGELCIYVNESGRVALIELLQGLSMAWDHEHLLGRSWSTDDIGLDEVAYRDEARVISAAKILFRPDAWDEEHFPKVMNNQPQRLFEE